MLARADIPAIEAQPTLTGRTIVLSLATDDGAYLGSGDYDANTGEIDLIRVAPDGTVTTVLAAFDTEQVTHYRELLGAVWTTSVDPRGSNPASLATDHGGTWHTTPVQVDGLLAVHAFDVTTDPDTDDLLVTVQRSPDTACVWRSTDLGVTWTEDLAHVADGGGFNRFYLFGHQGGAPVVTTTHGTPAHYVLTAGEWVPAATVTLDTVAEIYDMSTLPDGGTGWTAALAPDGSVWLCDGDAIYLLPPPD